MARLVVPGVGIDHSGFTTKNNMATKPTYGLLLASLFLTAAGAVQTQAATSTSPVSTAVSRLAGDWQSTSAVQLLQSAPPQFRASVETGVAPANQPLTRMLLLLASSDTQQKALAARLADQQNSASSSYHHWLTPSEFGAQFGNSTTDVAAVVAWLQSQGFTVAQLPAGRGWIEFSGTAAQVEQAFGAQVTMVSGARGLRPALTGSISVPAALAPLVQGLVSLDGVLATPATSSPQSMTVTAAELATRTSASTSEALTPALVSKLVHLDALQSSGVTGKGQTIAIPSRGAVYQADVAAFRSAFGLPVQALKVQATGTTPAVADDQAVATLAASWAGAAAPGAQIVLVPTASTEATDGVDLSLAAIVDNELAQTVVVGYSSCEAGLSAAHQAFYTALYQQAAAEGIAVVVASGDTGAAACSAPGSTALVSTGYAVNGLASTPWNAAVGVAAFSATGAGTEARSLAAWSPAVSSDPEYAGGGGASSLAELPSWQAKFAQNASKYRQLPDLSLPTAIDSSSNRGLAFCLSATEGAGQCTLVRSGGSAAAAAIFGGIAALVAEQHGTQGTLQSSLYALAGKQSVYTDVEQGTAQLACTTGTAGCDASGQIGYAATSGYDQATGLGVVNAQGLVTSWVTALVGTGAATVTMSVSPMQDNFIYDSSATITFAAQVVSGTGGATPTGTVVFYDTTTAQSLSSALTLNASGVASWTTNESVFAMGANQMVAQYSGDATYAAVTSTPSININLKTSTTTTVLTPSTTTPAAGSTMQLNVTVTPATYGSSLPSGTVTFLLDGTALGSATLTSGSPAVATYTFTMPSAGAHTLSATYAGDTYYSSSTATPVALNASKGTPTVSVTPSTSTPAFGSTMLLTATISPASTAATYASGTVTFSVDGVAAGTSAVTQASPSTATLTINAPALGSHTITATYSGDTNYNSATSSSVNVTVSRASTTLTVTPATTTPAANSTLLVTATLASTTSSTLTATGTVAFLLDNATVATVTLNGSSAVATLTMPATGTHAIQAIYSGDTNFYNSTATGVNVTVAKSTTSITLTPSTTTPALGATLPVSIAVTAPTVNTALPSGTVTISVDGVATAVQTLASGNPATASATLAALSPGTHTLTATFSGDTYYATSTSSSITVTVPKLVTTTVMTPATTTPSGGASLAVSATITPSQTYSTLPSGTVSFTLDGTSVSSVAVISGSPASASATIASTSLTPGTHALAAVYSGDTVYATSTSSSTTLTIAKSATTTTVVPSTLTPTAGGSMTVTVNVTSSNAATALPSGTVTLVQDGVTVGTGTLTAGSPSVATITLNVVAAGTHVLQATYAGDTYYTASNSSTVSILANKGASVTTVTASPVTLTAGTSETLTATVAPSTAITGVTYTLTGTVRFYDGATLLGTVAVSSNTAVLSGLTFKTNVNHTITAIYSGDTNFGGSTSSVLTLSATTLPDYVVLTSNYSVAPPGVAVVLTATVTPTTASTTEANPTGLVIFYIGTTVIGQATLTPVSAGSSSSVATLTSQTLPAGTDVIYAVYQGDDYYNVATSNDLSITVQDFTLTSSSSNPATNLTIVKGSSGSVSYDIAGLGGFSNLVQVVCAVPTQDDMTCTASPQQVTPPGTVTFAVQTFKTGTTTSHMQPPPLWPRAMGGTALAAIGFLFLPYGRRVRRRLLARAGKAAERGLLLILLLAGLVGSGVGCTNSQNLVTVGTPLGVSTLKITATAYVNNTTVSHSVYLTVNVVTSL